LYSFTSAGGLNEAPFLSESILFDTFWNSPSALPAALQQPLHQLFYSCFFFLSTGFAGKNGK
jgi:hypothetical protein